MEGQKETPALVHGIVAEHHQDTIVLALPGSDYRLDLPVAPALASRLPPVGATVRGVVHGRAMRVDVVRAGGRFIEPIYGRPRHAQGMVREIDANANTLTVQTACPLVCTLAVGQRAEDFAIGQLVAFDLERGTGFEPLAQKTQAPLPAPPHAADNEHAHPIPNGPSPTQGPQGAEHAVASGTPGEPSKDAGALGTNREITGMEATAADFPIDGEPRK